MNKIKTWAKSYWQQSHLRQSYLTYKVYNLPLLRGNKPIADVYLTLNDPHSFMLLQALISLEKSVNLTFNLYLVSGPSSASKTESVQSKELALKDANHLADKFGLVKAQVFPSIDNLITGQQTWLLKVKTLKDALSVFKDTWFGNFIEHYTLSTPVITAQINNRRRLLKKGHDTSGAVYFCGVWFSGIESIEEFKLYLNEKGLLNRRVTVEHNVDDLALSDHMINEVSKPKIESPLVFKKTINNYPLSEEYLTSYKEQEAS